MAIGFRPKCPMSAYSASAPVTARKMAPTISAEIPQCAARKLTLCTGLRAHSTTGCRAMWTSPITPSARNQAMTTGPKMLDTRAVPKRWKPKSRTRMPTVSGSTKLDSDGVIDLRPSTADSTEIAGVMIEVAEEQRRADDADCQDPCRPVGEGRARQCGERQNAALALVVRPGDEEHVFHRHDQEQRPGDQRQQPEHIVLDDAVAKDRETLPEGVDRTGADIAVDDAERTQHQHRHAVGLLRMRGVADHGIGHRVCSTHGLFRSQ